MEIEIVENIPQITPFKAKGGTNQAYTHLVKIPDFLAEKTIALIEEISDRLLEYVDSEESESFYEKRSDVLLSIYPLPFCKIKKFKKRKVAEKEKYYSDHIKIWSNTDPTKFLDERRGILNILNDSGAVWFISEEGSKQHFRINKEVLHEISTLIKEKTSNFTKKKGAAPIMEKTINLTKGDSDQIITKKNGDFFYKNTLLELGKETTYGDVLDVLCLNCIQDDFISYDKINEELIKRKWERVSSDKARKRIINAITNGVFRFARVNGTRITNKAGGKKLIEIVRGKGIRFNNSKP